MITTEEIEHLYRRHYRRMYIVARTMLSDDAQAGDVVNDVFADILGGKTIVPPGCSDGWWVVAVRNRCLNIIGSRSVRQRVEQRLSVDSHVDTAQSEADIIDGIDREASRLDRVLRFIDTELTEQTRRVLLMHYRDRKKYRLIAAELGISETAVYKHLSKGISRIKDEFAGK